MTSHPNTNQEGRANTSSQERAELHKAMNKAGFVASSNEELDFLLGYFADREAKKNAMHISDVARAVGVLQGLGHPDKHLEDRLATLTDNTKGES